MKKTLFKLLIAVSILALGIRFGTGPLLKVLGLQSRAGIKVTSSPGSVVTINGQEVGKTPYLDESLPIGEYKVQLASDTGFWQGVVTLIGGTTTMVNRDLAEIPSRSSGEVLSLRTGNGALISSNPTGAQVDIDGKAVGETPFSASDLGPGEHSFLLSHEGFVSRNIRASIPQEMTLVLNVDLALSDSPPVAAFPTPTPLPEVTILQTSTGFLRVRKSSSVNSQEVGRVSPGDNLVLIDETAGWYKIKMADGTEGYISSQYARKE